MGIVSYQVGGEWEVMRAGCKGGMREGRREYYKILVADGLIIYTLVKAYLPLPKFSKKVLTREVKYPKLLPSCEGRNFPPI
jgi:hypothetical protein